MKRHSRPDPTQVAIYSRVSISTGSEADGTTRQAHRCVEHLRSEGYSKHDVGRMQHFKDTAHSGRDLNRPQLQRLLHEVREGRVRHIVFTDSTRIARKFPDFLLLAERLTEQGCSFVSLDRINGTSTPTSRLVAVGQCALSHHDEEVPCEKA